MSAFLFSQPTIAPGREGSAPATPQQTQPAQGTPPPTGGESPSPFNPTTILLLVAPLLLFFFMSRNQKKKQQQLEGSLKAGDRVVTRSGMIGKVIDIGERTSKLEIAPGVTITVLKTSIEGLDGGDAKPADSKKDVSKDGKELTKDKPQEKKA